MRRITHRVDRVADSDAAAILARSPIADKVCHAAPVSNLMLLNVLCVSGHAELRIPQPFSLRVRKALNADPKSVKLSQLVGTGGSWYSFGLQISDLCVPIRPCLILVLQHINSMLLFPRR